MNAHDIDILANVHHAHANALQALMALDYDKERLKRWTTEFEDFRQLYIRLAPTAPLAEEYPPLPEEPAGVCTVDDGPCPRLPGARLEHCEDGYSAEQMRAYVDADRTARDFPPLKPELASILGMICFQCVPVNMHPDRKWPEWRQPCSYGTPTIEDYPVKMKGATA